MVMARAGMTIGEGVTVIAGGVTVIAGGCTDTGGGVIVCAGMINVYVNSGSGGGGGGGGVVTTAMLLLPIQPVQPGIAATQLSNLISIHTATLD